MSKKKERNSSIELLRIIAIIGVVLLHYNNSNAGGGFKYVTDGSINQYYLYFIENLFVCAVDLFIMISAFYLSATKKRRIIKIVELNIQVVVFRVAGYLLSLVMYGNNLLIKSLMGCFLPVNYFVILYSVIYVLSPYMNVLIEKLNKRDFKKLIVLLVTIFSVWTISVDFLENITGNSINGLSTVGMYGSQYGYSIVNFILIYFIASYIRVNEIKLKKKNGIILIVTLVSILYFMSIMEHKIGLMSTTTWNYNNPLIILLAALIMLLFMNNHYNNKMINELARGTFTCFLLHGYLIGGVYIEEFVNESIFVLVVHQICVAIGMYLISYIVHIVYSICIGWFIKLITPIFDKMDISLE